MIKIMIKNKNGYMGIIAILVGVIFAALWMAYLWNKNWFGSGINVPSLQNQNNQSGNATTANPGDINNQLNTLRKDIKNIQDKKDQEIINELNK